MNIAEILEKPESKTLEFKRDLSSLRPILKTLVAFANTAGGTLVIGIDDNRQIRGITDIFKAEERLTSAIVDNIRPILRPEIEIYSLQDKSLLVVQVPHWRAPFYLKQEGPEPGVYIRIGSSNRQASPEILAELKRTSNGLSFDQLPIPELSKHVLDLDRLYRTFEAIGRKTDEKKLESLGLLVPFDGKLVVSNGGLILFGNEQTRERFFPDARVSCARFRGVDKAEFLDRLDVEGSVLDAIDAIPKFIRRNTRMAAKIEGIRRQDLPEYPELALREVIINAIVHADYSQIGMRITIAIYSDRLEIQNPGMLPFGMTLDDFKSGVSKIRNRVLARVFTELGLIEAWGSGYDRIVKACRLGGYPEPEWHEPGLVLQVVFRPHPAVNDSSGTNVAANNPLNDPVNVPTNDPINVPINPRQQWLLDQLGAGIRVKAADLASHWGVSVKTARRDILILKAQGLIAFFGAQKNGHYRLVKP